MACESLSAMMMAVCDMAVEDIKARVDLDRAGGMCVDRADGGVEFYARGAIPNQW
jgi:hypothetical protein